MLARKPDMEDWEVTAAQAALYGKMVMADPETKAIYAESQTRWEGDVPERLFHYTSRLRGVVGSGESFPISHSPMLPSPGAGGGCRVSLAGRVLPQNGDKNHASDDP